MNVQSQPPEYSEALLLRLVDETKSRDDLVQLNALYVELEEQGDIVITRIIVNKVKAREYYFKYNQFLNGRKH